METPRAKRWLRSALPAIPAPARLMPVAYSIADQALAVGGGVLVNVALARTQTKEEYGMFALSYSVFILLLSLYYAAILEPFTVYGSGRYHERFSEYLRLIVRSNVLLGVLLTGILLLICGILSWIAPHLISRALWGLALTAPILLSSYFLRRVFYVQRQPALAAGSSLVFFLTVACGLGLTSRAQRLDSLSVFFILALGWITAGAAFARRFRFGRPKEHFLDLEPHYWREHWKYSKWVLATAFVFQLTTQGYYWLVAGFLSTKEVGELRAMYLLVGPVDQALIALSYLVVPALAAHYAAKRMGNFLSLWKRFALATVGATALFALAVRAAGKPVMHLLYAGKYDGLAAYLFVLALLPLVMWIGSTMAQALNAVEKPQFVFWAYVSSGAATFFGGIPLVIHYGLRGAVYGMLLSGSTYTVALTASFVLTVCNKARWETAATLSQNFSRQPLAEEKR
jgi:O-antigen/teichoic acid export membrane protein